MWIVGCLRHSDNRIRSRPRRLKDEVLHRRAFGISIIVETIEIERSSNQVFSSRNENRVSIRCRIKGRLDLSEVTTTSEIHSYWSATTHR